MVKIYPRIKLEDCKFGKACKYTVLTCKYFHPGREPRVRKEAKSSVPRSSASKKDPLKAHQPKVNSLIFTYNNRFGVFEGSPESESPQNTPVLTALASPETLDFDLKAQGQGAGRPTTPQGSPESEAPQNTPVLTSHASPETLGFDLKAQDQGAGRPATPHSFADEDFLELDFLNFGSDSEIGDLDDLENQLEESIEELPSEEVVLSDLLDAPAENPAPIKNEIDSGSPLFYNAVFPVLPNLGSLLSEYPDANLSPRMRAFPPPPTDFDLSRYFSSDLINALDLEDPSAKFVVFEEEEGLGAGAHSHFASNAAVEDLSADEELEAFDARLRPPSPVKVAVEKKSKIQRVFDEVPKLTGFFAGTQASGSLEDYESIGDSSSSLAHRAVVDNRPDNWHTILCRSVAINAICRFGKNCNYAHSIKELDEGRARATEISMDERRRAAPTLHQRWTGYKIPAKGPASTNTSWRRL